MMKLRKHYIQLHLLIVSIIFFTASCTHADLNFNINKHKDSDLYIIGEKVKIAEQAFYHIERLQHEELDAIMISPPETSFPNNSHIYLTKEIEAYVKSSGQPQEIRFAHDSIQAKSSTKMAVNFHFTPNIKDEKYVAKTLRFEFDKNKHKSKITGVFFSDEELVSSFEKPSFEIPKALTIDFSDIRYFQLSCYKKDINKHYEINGGQTDMKNFSVKKDVEKLLSSIKNKQIDSATVFRTAYIQSLKQNNFRFDFKPKDKEYDVRLEGRMNEKKYTEIQIRLIEDQLLGYEYILPISNKKEVELIENIIAKVVKYN